LPFHFFHLPCKKFRPRPTDDYLVADQVFIETTKDLQMTQKTTGIALATAAAAIFAMGAFTAPASFAADMSVHCVGINSCKGTSDCKTAKSECKGLNSCKGQGWVSKASAAECTKAGGTVGK
jgi:hypothetical protein